VLTLHGSPAVACCPAPVLQVATCVRLSDDLLRSEDPAFKMHPKPIVTSRFLVLPEMIGPAIIGKGGTHAKHIKERTSVRIEVVREYSPLLGAEGPCGAQATLAFSFWPASLLSRSWILLCRRYWILLWQE
jgi:hypothetical protein